MDLKQTLQQTSQKKAKMYSGKLCLEKRLKTAL